MLGNNSSRIDKKKHWQASSRCSGLGCLCLQLVLALTWKKLCHHQIPSFTRAWRSVVLSPFLAGRVLLPVLLLAELGWRFPTPWSFSFFLSLVSSKSQTAPGVPGVLCDPAQVSSESWPHTAPEHSVQKPDWHCLYSVKSTLFHCFIHHNALTCSKEPPELRQPDLNQS